VAPPAVVAAFPATPPPDSQVTFVPFSNQADTTEGGGTSDTTAPPPVGTPTTVVPKRGCLVIQTEIDFLNARIASDQAALEGSSGKVKRLMRQLIRGRQQELRGLEKELALCNI
jgi:hypothetical protein